MVQYSTRQLIPGEPKRHCAKSHRPNPHCKFSWMDWFLFLCTPLYGVHRLHLSSSWTDIRLNHAKTNKIIIVLNSFHYSSAIPLKFALLGPEIQNRLHCCVTFLPLHLLYHYLLSHCYLEVNYLQLQKCCIQLPTHMGQELACLCHVTCSIVHVLLVWYGSESQINEHLVLSVLQLLLQFSILSIPLLLHGSFVRPFRWMRTILCHSHIKVFFSSQSLLRVFNMSMYAFLHKK